MTIDEAYSQFSSILKNYAVTDALDETRVLICHVLKINSAGFFASPGRQLSTQEQAQLEELILRRVKGEPSAYIVNSKEFYGIELFVDDRVLVPRPETEILVEEALKSCGYFGGNRLSIADVGTGSGAIAVALALNLPVASIYAIDISSGALEVAACNIKRYNLQDRVTLLQGDLLDPLPQPVDMIVANLPYIPADQVTGLQVEVSGYEPHLALEGGVAGTEVIERLINRVQGHLNKNGVVLLEFGLGQEEIILNMVKKYLPEAVISFKNDLAGIKRIAKIDIQPFDIDECLL